MTETSELQNMIDKAVAKAVANLVPREVKVKPVTIYKIDPNKNYADNVTVKLSYPFSAKQIATLDRKCQREGLSRAEGLRRAIDLFIHGNGSG